MDELRESLRPEQLAGREVFHYSIPALSEHGDGVIEDGDSIASSKFVLRGGELLVSKLNPRKGHVYVARAPLTPTVCSSEFIVLRPRACDVRFMFYFFSSETVRQELAARVQSVTKSHQRVGPDEITKMWVRVPNVRVQRAIADFLDRETARLDEVMRLHVRLGLLVDERYRAKLDSQYSSSGWPLTRLKHLLAVRPSYGVLVPRFVDAEGTRFVRVSDLSTLEARADQLIQIHREQSEEYGRTIVTSGDVLVSVVGSLEGVAIVGEKTAGCNIARAVARLRPRKGVAPKLLAGWVGTSGYVEQAAAATADDSVQPTLNMGDLANFELRFPADPESQWAALHALITTEGQRDKLESRVARQIRLLQELRQTLITSAVTGQLAIPGGMA